jgi:hypothetical protein
MQLWPSGLAVFFIAVAGAAAALTGLLLISSALTLVPQKNPDSPLLWSVSRMTSSAAASVPGTLAGLSLAVHWGGRLYWLVPAALLGIADAVYGAWVLLVEIVR